MPINKQPVFTTSPVLSSGMVDVVNVSDKAYDIDLVDPTVIFSANDSFGTLVERVTLCSTGDLTNTVVTAKLIYLCIYDGKWNIYKTVAMPGTIISDTTPNPEIEWVFTGGLLLPTSYKLGLASTAPKSQTGERGDLISYTVEGSTYSQV